MGCDLSGYLRLQLSRLGRERDSPTSFEEVTCYVRGLARDYSGQQY